MAAVLLDCQYFDLLDRDAFDAHQQLRSLRAQPGVQMQRGPRLVRIAALRANRVRLAAVQDERNEARQKIIESHYFLLRWVWRAVAAFSANVTMREYIGSLWPLANWRSCSAAAASSSSTSVSPSTLRSSSARCRQPGQYAWFGRLGVNSF